MNELRFTYIRDLTPNMKSLNLQFIVLDIGIPYNTKDGNVVRTVKAADKTASVNISVWDDAGAALHPGDICRLLNCFTAIHKMSLVVNVGKYADLQKIGEFCMVFVEVPDMSIPNSDYANLVVPGKPVGNNDGFDKSGGRNGGGGANGFSGGSSLPPPPPSTSIGSSGNASRASGQNSRPSTNSSIQASSSSSLQHQKSTAQPAKSRASQEKAADNNFNSIILSNSLHHDALTTLPNGDRDERLIEQQSNKQQQQHQKHYSHNNKNSSQQQHVVKNGAAVRFKPYDANYNNNIINKNNNNHRASNGVVADNNTAAAMGGWQRPQSPSPVVTTTTKTAASNDADLSFSSTKPSSRHLHHQSPATSAVAARLSGDPRLRTRATAAVGGRV